MAMWMDGFVSVLEPRQNLRAPPLHYHILWNNKSMLCRKSCIRSHQMDLFCPSINRALRHRPKRACIPLFTNTRSLLHGMRAKRICVCDFYSFPSSHVPALDLALTFWDLLLPYAPTYDADGTRASAGTPSFSATQYELWKRFLTSASHVQVISKDTWSQFLEFTREIDPKFANHDFEAAWPSVIDEFVAWVREQP